MNIINPTITIQNLEGRHYLVRFQHDRGNGELLDCTVKIDKGSHTLAGVSALALDRIRELAQAVAPKE